MKNKIKTLQQKFWLISGVYLIVSILNITCKPEYFQSQLIEVHLQIPLAVQNQLKSGTSTTSITSVVVTVSANNEVLTSTELTISGNTASGTITLSPGENRLFAVEARDENDILQWSGSTTTDVVKDGFTVNVELSPVLPSAVSLQAEKNENSVMLSWSQNSDPDFGRYELYKSLSENSNGEMVFTTLVASETEYTDAEVGEGNDYFYTLIVIDTEELKSESNVVHANFPLIPPTQSILDTVLVRDIVNLFWTQNHDNDFVRYALYRSDTPNERGDSIFSTTMVADTIFEDNTVEGGKIYYYTLIVSDTLGLTTVSNLVEVEVPDYSPTASTLEGSLEIYYEYYAFVSLSWSRVPDPDFARYELHRSVTKGGLGENIYSTKDIASLNYTDYDVTEGNIYYYTLVVFNTKEYSSESNVVTIDYPGNPPAPSTLNGSNDGYNYFSWSRNYDYDFAKYELYRSEMKNDTGSVIYSTTDVNDIYYTDEAVIEGKTYYYLLFVFDVNGFYSASNQVQIEMPNYTPGASKLQLVSADTTRVELYWSENFDNDFDRYELYRSETDNELGELIHSTDDSAELVFEDTDVTAEKVYYYTLVVYDFSGLNATSNVVQVIL